MRRPPSLSIVAPAAFALALVAAAALPGCQSADPLPSWQREDVETLAVRPEWQRFVDENYRGTVVAHLGGPRGVRFELPPRATATRNKSRNVTELLAVGEADVPDAAGKLFRRPYTIVWRQSGGSWRPHDVRIEPGVEYRPPAERPQAPATRLAAAPAAG